MNNLEEIKTHVDIVDYIGKYVTLHKAGRNFKAPCPFHSEKSPSFIVSPERQIWHCFGSCGEGGDIIAFVMKREHVGFVEAAHLLAEQAGIPLSLSGKEQKQSSEKERLLSLNQYAAEFYQYILEKHAVGKKAQEYLKKRGITPLLQESFSVGYAPNSWDSLTKFLQKKGFKTREFIASGMVGQGAHGKLYDRFRGRIMFPLKNIRGQIIGFSGRVLNEQIKQAKYINTPETLLYHKREHLFGIDRAKEAIIKKNEIILMEGEFDVILAHKNGYTNAVAVKGSALTQEHVQLIKRLTSRIVFAFDMDKAGEAAIKRGVDAAEKEEVELYCIRFDGGKDPADLFSENPLLFKKYYLQKISIYEFLIRQAVEHHDLTTIYGKKQAVDSVAPYLAHIYNPIVKDYFIKLLAEQTDIEVGTIEQSMRMSQKKIKKMPVSGIAIPQKTKNREELLEEYLLTLLLQTQEQKYFFSLAREWLAEEEYTQPAVYKLIQEAQKVFAAHPTELVVKLGAILPPELLAIFNRAYLRQLPESDPHWRKEIKKTILTLKRESLKKQIKHHLETDNTEAAQKAVKEQNKLEKELRIV